MDRINNQNLSNDFVLLNDWLFTQYNHMPSKHLLALPYLTTPTIEYSQAALRIVVENRETNGWGEKEFSNTRNLLSNDLERLYISNINKDWNNLGSVWPMYYALRALSEGDNPLECLKGKVGFIHSNVALIGRKYGNTGFEPSIKDLLIQAQDNFLKACKADILLLGIGFGSKANTEQPYLEILEKTYLGKLLQREKIEKCETPLYRLFFENSHDLIIFGYGHPQGLSYVPIVDFLKDFIINLVNNRNPSFTKK